MTALSRIIIIVTIVHLYEVCGRDQLRLPVDLVPKRHFLVGDVPQAEFPVQGGAQEELGKEIQFK